MDNIFRNVELRRKLPDGWWTLTGAGRKKNHAELKNFNMLIVKTLKLSPVLGAGRAQRHEGGAPSVPYIDTDFRLSPDQAPQLRRPVQSKTRAPLFVARTLNGTSQSRVTPSPR